jgi:hypothetical protein
VAVIGVRASEAARPSNAGVTVIGWAAAAVHIEERSEGAGLAESSQVKSGKMPTESHVRRARTCRHVSSCRDGQGHALLR